MNPGPASEWAAQQAPGTPLKWKQLEVAAWRDHPAVLRALGAGAASKWVSALLLTYVFAIGAPVLELAAAIGSGRIGFGRFGPSLADSTRVGGSGIFAAVAVVGQILVLLGWRTGTRERDGFVRGHAVLCVVAGVLALLVVVRLRDSAPAWGALCAAAVIVSIVVGIATIVLMQAAPAPAAKRPGPIRAGVPRAVAALTDDQRARVRADLESALDDLRTRSVISAKEREKVRDAPLGMLTVTLNSSRKRTSLD